VSSEVGGFNASIRSLAVASQDRSTSAECT
jgi:hypothetical protein